MDNEFEEIKTKIIDNGTYEMKAGFAGEEEPSIYECSMICYPKNEKDIKLHGSFYVGENKVNELREIRNPIEHGAIKNWDDMEIIWDFIFKQMSSSQLSPNQSVFLIDSLLNPKINRAKMSEIMFEKYNFQYFYSGNQSPIALYSGGRKSGVSVNIGEGTTQIVPVNEGIPIFNAISELNISGIEIKQMFKNFLSDRGYSFNDPTTSIWNTIISNALYVANDYESELTKAKTSHKCDMTIHINETQEITISYERFCCYEQLFRRQINGFNEKGIVDILYDSIMSVDRKERKYFCVNICLFGGSSLVDGLAERIMNELSNKVKKEIGMTIVRSSPERRISSWIGASVFASLPYYEQMYIRKKEYDEYGVSLVLNKCFY